MAVVSLKSPWTNADGLNVYFPGDAGTVTRGGERPGNGRRTETFVEIDLTTLPAFGTGNSQIVAENVTVPKGAFIEDVEVLVTQAATGATATFSADLVKLIDRTTLFASGTGLVSAATVASMSTLGNFIKYNKGSTSAGSLIGTQITTDAGLIVASCATANFTAGKIELRVHWLMPNSVDL